MNSKLRSFIYLLSVVLLASCHSSKKMETSNDTTESTTKTTTKTITKTTTETKTATVKKPSATEKLLQNVDSTTNTDYTAKIKVNLKANNKSVSTSGHLRMRWNEVIQISLVDPVLGIAEIGRLEFSRDNVLLVDRVNKQYVQESYEALSKLAKSELSYEYVQALFWSEAQKPNNDNITYKIPLKKPVTLNLVLSDVNHKNKWDAHYEVSSKYKKITPDEFIKSLSSLAK